MKPFKLQVVTAYVAIHPDGTEGIMGALMDNNTWLPLIGGDPERMTQLYPKAVEIASKGKLPFRILQFSVREDITEKVMAEFKGRAKN